MHNKFKSALLLAVGLLLAPLQSFADGGIALGATRVIYPQGASQTSLPISNSSTTQRFLINSWIENANGKKDSNFVVTPPLFVSEAKTENTLRIIYAGAALPKDRETLFYLNVKAIPSLDKNETAGKNILQLAILSRIKLFVRPDNLPTQPTDAPQKLKFNRTGNSVQISNPTPYYITLVNITSVGKKPQNVMVAPMNSANLDIAGSEITFQSINDYGALTPPQTRVIK
ncbi:fimbria/pilus periplasmic chaperone [Serratia sp. M24T3]|uniref:fimbria/pilus periplasmic chaperone n=1 Tax=Serratia sp. M24T3 TaxID=932213 RepID=UPI00025B9EFF|nr:fimbria/pilus periplasmic chaperone [Serratia sp. M24T3]EIC85996.1 fimbrial chaperone protein FimC [Serratia sp. M24T3]